MSINTVDEDFSECETRLNQQEEACGETVDVHIFSMGRWLVASPNLQWFSLGG